MILIRMLTLLAIGYGIYRLVRHFRTRPQERLTTPGSTRPLVRCSRCDTLIPPENALIRGDRLFCSEKCRTAS
ncbi:MAG: hypothetical protein HQM00_09200 [Magnetococcales bacterium]|nr:hypothetical protein [Magnetococcales bacterium]